MRSNTIKRFVEEKCREGLRPLVIQRLAREKFPHKCCGLNYIEAICRRVRRAEEQERLPK